VSIVVLGWRKRWLSSLIKTRTKDLFPLKAPKKALQQPKKSQNKNSRNSQKIKVKEKKKGVKERKNPKGQ
jgi:hypothetical protein